MTYVPDVLSYAATWKLLFTTEILKSLLAPKNIPFSPLAADSIVTPSELNTMDEGGKVKNKKNKKITRKISVIYKSYDDMNKHLLDDSSMVESL